MTLAEWIVLLVVVALLIFGSALFSGLEAALFALRPHQLQRLGQNHAGLSRFIHLFRDNPRRVLNVLLLGDVLVNVPLVILCLFVLWNSPLAGRVPEWLTALVIFAIVVLVCDLIPKLVALSAPYRLSAIGALALQVSVPLLDHVGQFLENLSASTIDLLTPRPLRTRAKLSDEELGTLVEIGEEEGSLHEAEGEMIQEIIKLGDKTAKDCMTPRVDAFALPDDLSNEAAIERLKEKRYRRVPVYADTPDNVLGVLDTKSFLLNTSDHYTENLMAPSFVSETMRALDLLRQFLTHTQGIAIVVDEFGGTEGVITFADIVEEILSDALPSGDVDLYIERREDGTLLVSGNARLDDLAEYLGFTLETEGIDTIGGLVFNRLGHLPAPGTQLELPQLHVIVRRTGRKRIRELLLQPTISTSRDESLSAEGTHGI